MSTFEEATVYEYCELLYSKLINKDGGYYPTSKHDEYVFQQTSLHFGISIEQVDKIYKTHSKIVADIEMEKINKLPPALRQKKIKQKIRDIIVGNRDLPFYEKEGPPSEEFPFSLDVIEDKYKDMLEKMAQNGWTIPLTLGLENFNSISQYADDENKLDRFFVNYYERKKFKLMCKHIIKAIQNNGQKKRFEECVIAYNQELYSICLTTLTTVLEGLISLYGDNPTDVRIMRICDFNYKEARMKNQKLKSLSWLSMYTFTKILFEKSDFSQIEPNEANRHWIIHGRTCKTGEKADCLRVFNAISTLACIKTFEEKIK